MSHDWTHLFMGGMNYIDGRFVFEDMHELAHERKGERVVVTWMPKRGDELAKLTPRIRKCVRHLRRELPAYLERCRVEKRAIVEMRTEVYVGANARLYVRAVVLDDKGREHQSFLKS